MKQTQMCESHVHLKTTDELKLILGHVHTSGRRERGEQITTTDIPALAIAKNLRVESSRGRGPALFGLVTLAPSLLPTLFPQCLWSRKTVARPSFSITEKLQVVPKNLRTCCQAFNRQLMKCCPWSGKNDKLLTRLHFLVVEILST